MSQSQGNQPDALLTLLIIILSHSRANVFQSVWLPIFIAELLQTFYTGGFKDGNFSLRWYLLMPLVNHFTQLLEQLPTIHGCLLSKDGLHIVYSINGLDAQRVYYCVYKIVLEALQCVPCSKLPCFPQFEGISWIMVLVLDVHYLGYKRYFLIIDGMRLQASCRSLERRWSFVLWIGTSHPG